MSAQPARVLGLEGRGELKVGNYADVVVFDPATIRDHATYLEPHQYATGVSTVLINGVEALRDGEPTEARPGRAIRGRAWTGTRPLTSPTSSPAAPKHRSGAASSTSRPIAGR